MPSNLELLLAPYGPQLPTEQLVGAVNQIYHQYEARDYDRRHPEIHRQLPAIWREMFAVADRESPPGPWRILNIGCGTGFEAEQLLRETNPTRPLSLTCYDASPAMLERCRARLAPWAAQVTFCTDLRELPVGGFNILATNALLHHLAQPLALIASLLPRLEHDALWLAGHEPSRRYYTNPECLAIYQAFRRERRWRRFVDPRRYLREFRERFDLASDPARQTAQAALNQGLFLRRPTERLIGMLVDLHVAHEPDEAAMGRGFDLAEWRERLGWGWRCLWSRSYGYMGTFYETELPGSWRRAARTLAERYPDDGVSFSSIWRRTRS